MKSKNDLCKMASAAMNAYGLSNIPTVDNGQTGYPCMNIAMVLYHDYLEHIGRVCNHEFWDGTAVHCTMVAMTAVRIAAFVPEINLEKVHVLGLLHDYGGRYSEGNKELFHGTAGYEAMMILGYTDVARVCLTHSFIRPAFRPEDYTYPASEMIKARKLMDRIDLDDYDRLIQLSDSLVCGYLVVTAKDRLSALQKKYGIRQEAIGRKYQEIMALKSYFDEKCGRDVYEILGINKK